MWVKMKVFELDRINHRYTENCATEIKKKIFFILFICIYFLLGIVERQQEMTSKGSNVIWKHCKPNSNCHLLCGSTLLWLSKTSWILVSPGGIFPTSNHISGLGSGLGLGLNIHMIILSFCFDFRDSLWIRNRVGSMTGTLFQNLQLFCSLSAVWPNI